MAQIRLQLFFLALATFAYFQSASGRQVVEGDRCNRDSECDYPHTFLSCLINRGSNQGRCQCAEFTKLRHPTTHPYYHQGIRKCVIRLNEICEASSTAAKLPCEPGTHCKAFVNTYGSWDNGICEQGSGTMGIKATGASWSVLLGVGMLVGTTTLFN